MSSSRYSKLTIIMVLMINESMFFMAKANRSERWNRIHRSDLAGGGHAVRDGVQDTTPGERKTRATQVFDALVERPVGRYILAASSLAGECLHAYVPGPFRLMTSFLCTRVRDSLFSKERDVLGPDDGQSSRLSYKRFLSPEGNTDDYLDRLPQKLESAIQYKYSRVSAAFLVRHGIGHAIADDAVHDTGLCSATQDRARTSEPSKIGVLDESIQAAPSSRVEEKGASYSILNSLNNFRKMRRTVIEDDLDLLSEDLEDEDEPPVVGSRIKERGENKDVKKGITAGVSRGPPTDDRVRREGLETLNLISNGDEGARKLVNKLRGAHPGPKIRAEKVAYGDSTREKSV